MEKGKKIICLPGIVTHIGPCEVFYLEKNKGIGGGFYITTKEEITKSFDVSTSDHLFGGDVFRVENSDYIKAHSHSNLKKLSAQCDFLLKNTYVYFKFKKWSAFNYDYECIFETLFYKNLIKHFGLIKLRFYMEISILGFLGFFKRTLYLFCFFFDIVNHIFCAYFDYRASKELLAEVVVDSNSFISRVEKSHEDIQKEIKEKEEKVKIEKEKYFKINISFMTLVISILAIIFTICFNKYETSGLNKKIENLEQQNIGLRSIIDSKNLEIERLQKMDTELKIKQLEARLLELNSEIGLSLQSIFDVVENLKSENQE